MSPSQALEPAASIVDLPQLTLSAGKKRKHDNSNTNTYKPLVGFFVRRIPPLPLNLCSQI